MFRLRKLGLLFLTGIIIFAALVWIESNTHLLHNWIASVLYDNHVNNLSCQKSPNLSEAEQILEEHQEVIQQIENIHPGFIWVYIDSSSCSGKGILVIEYASHEDRLLIEEIVGETFFGVPWKGINI
jgi:hypothetical protein